MPSCGRSGCIDRTDMVCTANALLVLQIGGCSPAVAAHLSLALAVPGLVSVRCSLKLASEHFAWLTCHGSAFGAAPPKSPLTFWWSL